MSESAGSRSAPSDGSRPSGGGAAGCAADRLERLAAVARQTAEDRSADIATYADRVVETFRAGGRLLYCGNGGSAAIVEHMVTEYVVRFRRNRAPLPALSLTAPTSTLTAGANDFGYDQVFVRPLRALGRPGDLLVIHSTSGDSANCLAAARAARGLGIRTVALTSAGGGELSGLADHAIRVPSDETATVQELHLAIEHAVADHVDAVFAADPDDPAAADAAADGGGAP